MSVLLIIDPLLEFHTLMHLNSVDHDVHNKRIINLMRMIRQPRNNPKGLNLKMMNDL